MAVYSAYNYGYLKRKHKKAQICIQCCLKQQLLQEVFQKCQKIRFGISSTINVLYSKAKLSVFPSPIFMYRRTV